MALHSAIEWTQTTWNPVTGCSKVSPGCLHCYAEQMSFRLRSMGQKNYSSGFTTTLHPHMLDLPLRWKKPMVIFVNSMSDLFHEEVPVSFIQRVFEVMNMATRHTFQILTKRSRRMQEINPILPWSQNIWMGVSVESKKWLTRIDDLRGTDARLKFVSFEPLLEPLENIPLQGIDWVIVGGESGPQARPLQKEWVIQIKDACQQYGIPFFFKQWGGTRKKRAGPILDGRVWDAMPPVPANEGAKR